MAVVPFSRFHRPATIPAPIGSGIEPIYEEQILDGHKSLVKVAEEPISPKIQEALHDTLVYTILARYQRGDLNALNSSVGQFMDVVGMPTTLAEAQQKLIDVQRRFDQMPLDIRQRFNNDVNEYIESISNGDVKEILADLVPDKSDSVDTVVTGSPTPAEPVKE